MSEDNGPSAEQTENVRPLSHGRILVILAVLGVAGGITGFVFRSFAFGMGILIGTALAFVNYYWLRSSLRKIFTAAEQGERPKMLAGSYFIRYLVLAAVVAMILVSGLVPIMALFLGLAGFGFAVVIEGLIRMVSRG